MKVKCINNKGHLYITIGKTYEVVSIDADGDYIIIDDNGHDWWYQKQYFKTLSEIRNEKIERLLGE